MEAYACAREACGRVYVCMADMLCIMHPTLHPHPPCATHSEECLTWDGELAARKRLAML